MDHVPSASYPRSHLAFPVSELAEARRFNGGLLMCAEERSSDEWVDFDFYGHQIVAHKVAELPRRDAGNVLDGEHVPVPHFGVILGAWRALADRLRSSGVQFVVEPGIRFEGSQASRRAGDDVLPRSLRHALEFKVFRDPSRLFAKLVQTSLSTTSYAPEQFSDVLDLPRPETNDVTLGLPTLSG
jgi:extradiol dioxygenase family protein